LPSLSRNRLLRVPSCTLLFLLSSSAPHRDRHSFPTRRSSDLRSVSPSLRLLRPWVRFCPVPYARSFCSISRAHTARRSPCGMHPDRKSTRLNSSHVKISYAVVSLNKTTAGHRGDARPTFRHRG